MFFEFNSGRGGPTHPRQGLAPRGGMSQVGPRWLAEQLESPDHGLRLIDVREPYEFEAGHIEGAELIPLGSLTQAVAGWDRSEPLVMICRSGARSARATMVLAQMGFQTVHNLEGGMIGWSRVAR